MDTKLQRITWIFQLAIFTAAAVAAACVVYAWKNTPKIPSWAAWQDKEWSASEYQPDFDENAAELIEATGGSVTRMDDAGAGEAKENLGDAGAPDEIVLKDRTLTVTDNGQTVFDTGDLKVQDFLFGDIDHDGNGELMVLCWRIGRYGDISPFWEDEDEDTWSQHIYIYDWTGSEIEPEWMASDIGMDAAGWSFNSVDRLLITETSGRVTRWDWESWGLSFMEECSAPESVSILITGDNLIDSTILSESNLEHNDTYDFLYERYADTISAADIAVLNQETIFINDPMRYSGYPLFGTPSAVGSAAIRAGFDIAACANNHSLDMGMDGINDTAGFYEDNGKVCIGIQSSENTDYEPYTIVTKNGIKIAFLDYTYGTNGIYMPEEDPYAVHLLENESLIRSDIRSAKENADVCIVLVHWGTEYSEETDADQEKWTEVFLEENVDAVIGNHPHVLQPFGLYKRADGADMPVYYSLGNFVTHQTEEACRLGAFAEFTIVKSDKGCHIADVRRECIDAGV